MKFKNLYSSSNKRMHDALLSFWTRGNHPMRQALENLLEREPLLSKEVVFQSMFPWKGSNNPNWRQYFTPGFPDVVVTKKDNEGKVMFDDNGNQIQYNMIPYPPYTHQDASWDYLTKTPDRSVVVTSGTGSGKTECFMLPVLDDIANRRNNIGNGVQALFLYPLNALMEDQKGRLGEKCDALFAQGKNITFAVYNGSTEEDAAATHKFSSEYNTRRDIRNNIPKIILSNPSMLEYILVRDKDQDWIQTSKSNKSLKWIIIDEAHTYSGSAALELKYQIQRILHAFDVDKSEIHFACTSATITGGNQNALKKHIADLTGQDIKLIDIIDGERIVSPLNLASVQAALSSNPITNSLNASDIIALRDEINTCEAMELEDIWKVATGSVNGYSTTNALELIDALCDMQINGGALLSVRAHFNMKEISGIYACANPSCPQHSVSPMGYITFNEQNTCPYCKEKMRELVQCHRCGEWMYEDDPQGLHGNPQEDYYGFDDFGADDDETIAGNNVIKYVAIAPVARQLKPNATFRHMPLVYNNGAFDDIISLANITPTHHHCTEGRCAVCETAMGKRNKKHFRAPINYINFKLERVLLDETSNCVNRWGKYISFTDSRQGTAKYAKSLNVNSEQIFGMAKIYEKAVPTLPLHVQTTLNNPNLPQAIRQGLLAAFPAEYPKIKDIENAIISNNMFEHLAPISIVKKGAASSDYIDHQTSYAMSIGRILLGRRPLYNQSIEGLGLVTIIYEHINALNNIPNAVSDAFRHRNITFGVEDWKAFLKICLDYYVRVRNHIHPYNDPMANPGNVTHEQEYIRDSYTPSSIDCLPNVNKTNGQATEGQNRLILLLCAGLGITDSTTLTNSAQEIDNIMKEAWDLLIGTPHMKQDTQGKYYLDIRECRVKRIDDAPVWNCPVTHFCLDTIFMGYSPIMDGYLSANNFDRFKVGNPITISSLNSVPSAVWSDYYDDVNVISTLKQAYVAAEHSGQLDRTMLRDFVKCFTDGSLNVLQCSTTMEMGVDIGDIDFVLLNNVPPTSANYLQRAGRAGRNGQTRAGVMTLCKASPVGLTAFRNPAWVFNTVPSVGISRESEIIIQRHVNSYFFRYFVCKRGGLGNNTVNDFFDTIGALSHCDAFVNDLNGLSSTAPIAVEFNIPFPNTNFFSALRKTIAAIIQIRDEYLDVTQQLNTSISVARASGNKSQENALTYQLGRITEQNLLQFLTEKQFIPNANMPVGVVEFSYVDSDTLKDIQEKHSKYLSAKNAANNAINQQNYPVLAQARDQAWKNYVEANEGHKASREAKIALNEYVPGQTVVINERNYISEGINLQGTYSSTKEFFISRCRDCGRIILNHIMPATAVTCPDCGQIMRSVSRLTNALFTTAYEPVGFSNEIGKATSRSSNENKEWYHVHIDLTNISWNNSTTHPFCELVGVEHGEILFYNIGKGYGWAICQNCGRAECEMPNKIPEISNGHSALWDGSVQCRLNAGSIKNNVALLARNATSYSIIRFLDSNGLPINDEILANSLGVVLCRALTKYLHINDNEISFVLKVDRGVNSLVLYDTNKGGCGYSSSLNDPMVFDNVIDIAIQQVRSHSCQCELTSDDAACTECLIDSNTQRFANMLSKKKALEWLYRVKNLIIPVPQAIQNVSPNAIMAYHDLKTTAIRALSNANVRKVSLYFDESGPRVISEWRDFYEKALLNGKGINFIFSVSTTPSLDWEEAFELHKIVASFGVNNVSFILPQTGPLKTALVIDELNTHKHYFVEQSASIPFNAQWGDGCDLYVDDIVPNQNAVQIPSMQTVIQSLNSQGMPIVECDLNNPYVPSTIGDLFTCVLGMIGTTEQNTIDGILRGQDVSITLNDMYMYSALADANVIYFIAALKSKYDIRITSLDFQVGQIVDSYGYPKITSDRFTTSDYIYMSFEKATDSKDYLSDLACKELGVTPTISSNTTLHHRGLKVENAQGQFVDFRPDHGFGGGWFSPVRYYNVARVDANSPISKNFKSPEVLFYVKIKS